MQLIQRAPSLNWEPIPLDPSGHYFAWAWFRPATIPSGLMIAIPGAVFAESRIAARLSVRQLVVAVGLDASQIQCWSVNGVSFDAAGGNSPLLDHLLPAPPPEGQVLLYTWMEIPQPAVWQEIPVAATGLPMPVVNQSSPHAAGQFVTKG